MKKTKGFTVIELLVVTSVIAILVAIVLVNVTQYVNKGKDAGTKGNLATMMVDGAVWYENTAFGNGSYNNWITGAGTGAANYVAVYNRIVGDSYAVTATCNVASCAGTASTAWCAQVTLKANGKTYCVDSTGNKIEKVAGTCLVATGTCQ